MMKTILTAFGRLHLIGDCLVVMWWYRRFVAVEKIWIIISHLLSVLLSCWT